MIDDPEHIGIAPEVIDIETVGVTVGVTVMVTGADEAVEGLAQVALDVSMQVTTSASFNEDEVNVVLPVPILLPFTCH